METETPFQKKNCADCAHLKVYINLWCGNEEAKKMRGTAIPGVSHCPFWAPDWSEIPKEYHTAEYKPSPAPASNRWLGWKGLFKERTPF